MRLIFTYTFLIYTVWTKMIKTRTRGCLCELAGHKEGSSECLGSLYLGDKRGKLVIKLLVIAATSSCSVAPAGQQVAPEILAAHTAWVKGSKEIAGLMLMTMEPEIQRNLETLHANDMLKKGSQLARMFLRMKGYIDNLERLGHPVTLGLALHEQTLLKNNAPTLPAIRAGKVQKGNNKHKKHQPQMAAREDPAKDLICHEYGKIGHWKRNCPYYLAELRKKKKNAASEAGGSGIFTIELNTFLNRSWIYDTGCGTHICNTTQGLRVCRKLKPMALSLYMGNGHRKVVEAIGIFHLCLPSGLEIVLNNYLMLPLLLEDVIPRDDIFEIDLSNSYANESSMYAVSKKRAKLDLDSALLWHCLLGHISKKHNDKLQHDGLLNSTDLRSFEKCVPCMSGKMARKPYTHQVERAKDLLGLIHTDVCGPFKIMSRQGASYFVTFTDDFSRYGYVHLLKHKHEVFETFKVFQKEVENQLGKTIKSLRSDRGGEYMSQEFLDHLKDHEIIAHRTPPYTPQHNGVSERRNRTLLDMAKTVVQVGSLRKRKLTWMELYTPIKLVLWRRAILKSLGIDYEETFSPVADIKSIRILIAIVRVTITMRFANWMSKRLPHDISMKMLHGSNLKFCQSKISKPEYAKLKRLHLGLKQAQGMK
ncbi:retrotransposon protein, putative, ty1-copia subclass [Tanacetum coccineum]|uniref:Retrotransposon protein, putative, ty1-copia subclass n=1 Tax=Tanacetum coccineum TaxID=301880 RepID=A0ABQ4XRC4_9ASTR